jgi:signal peptidase I
MWNSRRNKTDASKKRFKPLRIILLISLGIVIIRTTYFNYNHVPSSSMNPNIFEGDVILVNKMAYDIKFPILGIKMFYLDAPERGDVVTFNVDGISFVKRVMGIPGDKISINKNSFHVNGEKLVLEYTKNLDVLSSRFKNQEVYTYKAYNEINYSGLKYDVIYAEGFGREYLKSLITESKEYTVPEGQYFMIGDNRNMSKDSRYVGSIPRKCITGKVVKIAYNYQQMISDEDMRFWEDTE